MKQLPLLFLALVLTSVLSAPVQAQSPVRFGLKGGLNIADLTGMTTSDTRTGGMIGVSLDIAPPLSPVGFETGIYYSQKGTEFIPIQIPEGDQLTRTLKLDYLEIPVLVRWNLGALPLITPHILAGPYIGFNVNAETETRNGGAAFNEDITEEVHPTDYGLIIGAGSDFHFGLASMNLQARYSFGFPTVFNVDIDQGEKHSVISVVLGFNL